MKKILYSFIIASSLLTTSCSDWLDLLPNNEQVADNYWTSKEEVESVVASGYYYLRSSVPTLIKWGELRGGTISTNVTSDAYLQNFNMTSSRSICNYSNFYKIINIANTVLEQAPGVVSKDDTYYTSRMNAHLTEAYFLRAFSYFTLVRNFKEVPLITKAYDTDKESFAVAKSTEDEIIAQIKSDIKTALATGAAKGTYDTDWETKGRATKWALYALMADVCLWNEDYDECQQYCDMILEATDSFRPVFIKNGSDWYTIFYPGNSNESIFEINWDYATYQETNNFYSLFTRDVTSPLKPTQRAVEAMRAETQELKADGADESGRMGRMLLATYVPSASSVANWETANNYYVWKYAGSDVADIEGGVRTYNDANFILYRVADVMLMKAEALVMQGQSHYKDAIAIINTIRNRVSLADYIDLSADDADQKIAQTSELTLLKQILSERDMEFVAEGKRWYDLLRFGRKQNFKYKSEFINMVLEGNNTTSPTSIYMALQNEYALYMPLPETDITSNSLLVQNPYYATTK